MLRVTLLVQIDPLITEQDLAGVLRASADARTQIETWLASALLKRLDAVFLPVQSVSVDLLVEEVTK